MRTAVSRQQRQWIISALLIALFVRALIPAGFMPAMDRPLSFQICPDGYPAQLLRQSGADAHAHHHHHEGIADDGALTSAAGDGLAAASAHTSAAHAAHHAAAMAGSEHEAMASAGLGATPALGTGEHTHSHHGIASGEHCVFAAVAAVGSFTFNSAFVSFSLEETSTRDVPYVSPALARERFVLPPSRGPPALS